MVSIFQIVSFVIACMAWAYAIRATAFQFLDKNNIKYTTRIKETSLWLIFALLMQLGTLFYIVQRLLSLPQA